MPLLLPNCDSKRRRYFCRFEDEEESLFDEFPFHGSFPDEESLRFRDDRCMFVTESRFGFVQVCTEYGRGYTHFDADDRFHASSVTYE